MGYQERLATGATVPALLDVPTGMGKTAAAVLAWLWRRRFAEESVRSKTPRRLVYCLPMRVLVEQTFSETKRWLAQLGLLDGGYGCAVSGDNGRHPIAVHLLLGGEDRTDWALWPDRDAILIGTQDMLLSRALNRGYTAGRARWPLEFGLLNNDCLWVFDEVQLMDTGLATSLQLDAWRESLPLRPTPSELATPVKEHGSKPCRSLWMSATLAEHWLEKAVDWAPHVQKEWRDRVRLTGDECNDSKIRSGQLFEVKKQLVQGAVARLEKPKTKENKPDKPDAERKRIAYLEQLAEHINTNHAESGLTLIIMNTVERATELFHLLRKKPGRMRVCFQLMHSRFRPLEREQWRGFLEGRCGTPRILVSTQVVEAGVDLSAAVLYTELAPWASLVQRFGRCARYPGESGMVYWADLDLGSDNQPVDYWARPYSRNELVAARHELGNMNDVGLRRLAEVTADGSKELFPYEPRYVPRDKDLFDLFDTTPDLTGADVDISRFIRDGEELDVQVFWRELVDGEEPKKSDRPQRKELCPVPFYRFRESLMGLRNSGRIWRRNYRKGWELVHWQGEDQVYPGQVFLLERSCGGYNTEFGWTGEPGDNQFDVPEPIAPSKVTLSDDDEDADELSNLNRWLTILEHTREVCDKLNEILQDVCLPASDQKILRLAARWHDRGKAHPVFQSKLRHDVLTSDIVLKKLAGEPAAKAPQEAWLRNGDRRGFRHELASALGILETLRRVQPRHGAFAWPEGLSRSDFDTDYQEAPESIGAADPLQAELAALPAEELDLLIYLVAAHHGKVRMSIRSSPDDEACPANKRQARGVRDDDSLPPCQIPSSDLRTGVTVSEVTLSLDPMELGLSAHYGTSWRERMQFLLERHGPFRLAYLEGILRAADCRASIG